jgi:hypothetical protein
MLRQEVSMKVLRIVSIALGALLVIGIMGAGIARLVINGPIGPLAGGELTGNQQPAPEDWNFTNTQMTIAVEVGQEDPHSVTVICFQVNDDLYIPAQDGADKDWPKMAIADGRAKVKIDKDLYPVRLVRVEDVAEREAAFESASEKYPQIAERASEGLPDSVWLFRAERRPWL